MIAVLGDSVDDGLVAELAIKARDEIFRPPLVKQMLIGAMLDGRITATKNEELAKSATWSHEDNLTDWGAYLGSPDRVGPSKAGDVSEYAAARRVASVKGLPSLY